MTVKIIVANDKGVVDKSTLAQFCAVELKGRRETVRVVEYDGQHRLGGTVKLFSHRGTKGVRKAVAPVTAGLYQRR